MSGPVDQGQTFRYRHTVKDANGVLANAGTVVFTVTLPDGTSDTPTVVPAATGVYDVAYTSVQSGLHQIRCSVTGGTLGTEFDFWADSFTVEEPGRTFLGVDEASAQLRAANIITSDSDREQLRWLCIVATNAVELDLARIICRRSITESYDGGKTGIQLRTGPVLSVTTVVESGTTLSASDYVLDRNANVLWRGSTTSAGWWADGRQNIAVTSVCGILNPPAAARMVGLYIVQSLWQSTQQAPHPAFDEAALQEPILAAASLLSALPQPLRNAYESLSSKR